MTTPTPRMSDVTTREVRVGATAFYLPDESRPNEGQYLFGYRIMIVNESSQSVRLLSRYWQIIDADGNEQEVRGAGVVGVTPQLNPQQAFKYTSYCPLRTSWGTMEGCYQMLGDNGETFDAAIGRFWLTTEMLDQATTFENE